MTKGIPYATDGIKAHRLDIMEPSGTAPAEGWPVIINIHGGGQTLHSGLSGLYCGVPADPGLHDL